MTYIAVGTVLGGLLAASILLFERRKERDILLSQWREVESWDSAGYSVTQKFVEMYDQAAEEEVDPEEVEQAISQLEVMIKEMETD